MEPRKLTPSERMQHEHRVGFTRAAVVGGSLIPCFGLLDWWLAARVYPDAHLGLVLLGRLSVTGVAFLSAVLSRSAKVSYAVAFASHAFLIGYLGFVLGAMAGEFGGPNSPYLLGMALVSLVRSAAAPERFTHAIGVGLTSVTTYLLALVGRYLWQSEELASWVSPETLNLFVAHSVILMSLVVCGAALSHMNWSAQQQIYEARRLGRFRLEAPLGRGGQNEVWLAWDGGERRQVALKILRRDQASGETLALFRREASLASQLTDPRTVRIYEFGASDDGVHFIAMEYLPGLDLAALVAGHGVLPVGRALYLAHELCFALEEAHQRGLVHRDVKPSNVMLLNRPGAFDAVKLLDFGIARSSNDADGHTRPGVVRGTPAYLAPECCRGEASTPRSDLYGVGATLFFLLHGEAPFVGSDVQVLAQRLTQEPASLASLRPELPAEVVALVHRCLATDPAARFESAAALRAALTGLCERYPWPAEARQHFWTHQRVHVEAVLSAGTVV